MGLKRKRVEGTMTQYVGKLAGLKKLSGRAGVCASDGLRTRAVVGRGDGVFRKSTRGEHINRSRTVKGARPRG